LQVHDDEMQALQSAKNSSRMLEDAYATGVAVLGQYAVQRDRLKSAQRKAYDVLNSVGMGNRLMRVIERRQKVDRWIAYGGMLVTVIILIVVIKWLR
jgi:Golgi SNAP receptor complex protein 2